MPPWRRRQPNCAPSDVSRLAVRAFARPLGPLPTRSWYSARRNVRSTFRLAASRSKRVSCPEGPGNSGPTRFAPRLTVPLASSVAYADACQCQPRRHVSWLARLNRETCRPPRISSRTAAPALFRLPIPRILVLPELPQRNSSQARPHWRPACCCSATAIPLDSHVRIEVYGWVFFSAWRLGIGECLGCW